METFVFALLTGVQACNRVKAEGEKLSSDNKTYQKMYKSVIWAMPQHVLPSRQCWRLVGG